MGQWMCITLWHANNTSISDNNNKVGRACSNTVFTSRERNVCCLCQSPASVAASLSSSRWLLGPTVEIEITYNTFYNLTLRRVLLSPFLLLCHCCNSHIVSFYVVLLCKAFWQVLYAYLTPQHMPWKMNLDIFMDREVDPQEIEYPLDIK